MASLGFAEAINLAAAADTLVTTAETLATVPTPQHKGEQKYSCMKVAVHNETQFQMVFAGSYFESGRFDYPPTNVKPFGTMAFSICNKNNCATGALAGVVFRTFVRDSKGKWKMVIFSFGCCDPCGATYETSANINIFDESESEKADLKKIAKDAYTKCKQCPDMVTKCFEGKDKDGASWKVFFDVAAGSSNKAVVTITQRLEKLN